MTQEMKSIILKEHLDSTDNDPLLLDVREPWEFERCHIEGSVLVPMRDIMSRMAELDPDRETVVICHHGIRSRRICQVLASNGFTNLINLSDGVDGWAKTVDLEMEVY